MSFISCRLRGVLFTFIPFIFTFSIWFLVLHIGPICGQESKHQLALETSMALKKIDDADFEHTLNLILNTESDRLGLKGKERDIYKLKLKEALTQYHFNQLVEARKDLYTEKELKLIADHYNSHLGQRIIQNALIADEFKGVAETEAIQNLYSPEEIQYEKNYLNSPMGKEIVSKVKKVKLHVINQMKQDNSLFETINQFNNNYLANNQ